ncbi:MAG: hypothetical protein K0R00_4403 [Herbinix sp.]|nr:hypothetical protein [Herbinix sp.]
MEKEDFDMSFLAYIDNITNIAEDMKATVFTDWLIKDYQLGHGHAMAMWKYFIDHKWIITRYSKV